MNVFGPTRHRFCLLLVISLLLCRAAAAQPLKETSECHKPVRLTFHGKIDGSEIIEISATHAHWIHRHWGWPGEAVFLNDVAWNPREQRSLDNTGRTRYLNRPVVFGSARLENMKGRDTVALDVRDDLVRVHISDTPNGADVYEFDIVFDPLPTPQSLRIRADIDGSDTLIIDKHGARWIHRHWDWPKEVVLNQVHWNPRKDSKLEYTGLHLQGAVDFAAARLTIHEARDLVALERSQDRITIHFADNPLGRADYDVVIAFGIRGDQPIGTQYWVPCTSCSVRRTSHSGFSFPPRTACCRIEWKVESQ